MTATPHTHLTNEQVRVACLALITGTTHADDPSDGPGVRRIAQADLDAMADEGADREERWLERGLR